ncbi:pimeloyl-ACP methyl ester carboxylesterase [Methylobacterium sp. BE186]|uniref:alpha/beta hydrolase n=1 Tax=Methylobacterium sp. BE186 TaxID=2817715 RepID=UPI002856D35D|nr:alpha/beta hydrolase [Methylobacterium sp. BE186]MDR7037438.1 pimeloyl-ACP methyl ester carboxylesterase [Methylobacterium sp. BE186]
MGVAQALAGLAGLVAALIGGVLGLGALASLLITLRAEAEFPPAGRFVPVAGGRLAAIEAGPREGARGTVILLHGASANGAEPMEGVGRLLAAQGFRVIAFDRPGFGWSDRLAAATPAAQGAVIAEALEGMGIGPAIVLGHSWSGALAASLALDHPERVAGLALVSPVALPFPQRPDPPWYWRLALQPLVAWLLSRTLGPPVAMTYLERAARSVFAPQAVSDDYLTRARAALVLRPGTLLANVQDLTGLPAALAAQGPRYGGIRVPTVIVAGEADPIVRTEFQARPLAQRIPGAELVVLPGIGHMVHYVAAEALAREVGRLAERIGERRPLPAAAP